jgi:Fe-S-cluster-containing dehydrogenase component
MVSMDEENIQIVVNKKVCSGCLSCVTTCSIQHESYVSLAAGRVQIHLRPFGSTHEIKVCRHCRKPLCLEACPSGALSLDEQGLVRVDYSLCDGCKECMEACPFDAMFWNPISEQVIKCDLCGGEPQCVRVCPTDALTTRMSTKKSR